MIKRQHIPLDVESSSKLGMDYCMANFGHVVSIEEFRWLQNNLLNRFVASLLSCDDDVFDATIIDYRFFLFLLQHAHLILLEHRASKMNAIVEYGYEAGLILQPNWASSSSFDAVFGSSSTNINRRVKDWLRTYRDTWRINSGSTIWKARNLLFSKHSIAALGISHNTHILIQDNTPDFEIFTDLYPYEVSGNVCTDDHGFLKRATTQYVEPLWEAYKYGLNYLGMGKVDDSPFRVYKERLGHVNGAREELIRRFSKGRLKNVSTIHTIGNSSAIRKLASLVGSRVGIEVEGFSHGYEQGLFHVLWMRARYLGTTSFKLPTKSIRDSYREIFSSDPLLGRLPTEFKAQNSSQLYDITKQKISSTKGQPRFDVMLIGWPSNTHRYPGMDNSYWYTQLDLQYRLVLALKKFGLTVVYKAHPDRINEVCNIFESIADEVNVGRLEEVWSKAKVFVFTSPVSTAIGYLAFTNRTMTLIDHPNYPWSESGKKRLRTRCRIVPADLSDEGRVLFCENQLYQAVTEDYVTTDEFINEYR